MSITLDVSAAETVFTVSVLRILFGVLVIYGEYLVNCGTIETGGLVFSYGCAVRHQQLQTSTLPVDDATVGVTTCLKTFNNTSNNQAISYFLKQVGFEIASVDSTRWDLNKIFTVFYRYDIWFFVWIVSWELSWCQLCRLSEWYGRLPQRQLPIPPATTRFGIMATVGFPWCYFVLTYASVTSHSRAPYGLFPGCSQAVLNKNRTSTHGARTGPVRRRTNFAFPYEARRVLMHAL